MSVHNAILTYLEAQLTDALITVPTAALAKAKPIRRSPASSRWDLFRATQIQIRPVSASRLHENDPDAITGASGYLQCRARGKTRSPRSNAVVPKHGTGASRSRPAVCWSTPARTKTPPEQIASTVRHRIEKTIQNLSFAGVEDDGEYVSRGAVSTSTKGEMIQSGGPPDAFDYFIKIRFEVQTTTGVFIA